MEMTQRKGYYDITVEIEKALIEGGMIDELFYL